MPNLWLRLSTCIIVMEAMLAASTIPVEANRGNPTSPVMIKSVQPNTLRLEPGTKGAVEVTGTNLQLARTIIARDDRAVRPDIEGILDCQNETPCTAELVASDEALPQAYTFVLTGKSGNELATLPMTFNITSRDKSLRIRSVTPTRLTLKPRDSGKVEMTGANLNLVAAVRVRRKPDRVRPSAMLLASVKPTQILIAVRLMDSILPIY